MYNFFLSQMCFFFTLRLATSIFSSRSSCCLHSKKTSEANEVKEALPLQQGPIELASPLWRDAVGHNSGPLVGGLTSEDASLPRPSPRPIEDKEAVPHASWVNRSSGLCPPGGVGELPSNLKTPKGRSYAAVANFRFISGCI